LQRVQRLLKAIVWLSSNSTFSMDSSANKSGPPVLRLAHLMAFTAFLRHIGAPVDRDLQRHKLPVLCDDPNAFVPLARAWSFFETAARHEDPALGWLVGAHVGDHSLNARLLRKLEVAPTLFQALQQLVQLASSEASHVRLGMHERQADVIFYTQYPGMRNVPGYNSSQSYQIGIIIDLIRHFLGRHWVPDEIGIEHTISPAVMEQHFPGSRILTQQPMGYIAVPRACLYRSVRRTDPESAVADNRLLNKNFDNIDTLRAMLKSYLPDGYPSARFAAELMDVSERTLARRLSARGLTYGKLVDEVRFAEAKQLLLKPGARIEDVAISIGFDCQSNFTRMFRRVGGLSPREFRKTALTRILHETGAA
jgi:AraC-like DNA-binding protein